MDFDQNEQDKVKEVVQGDDNNNNNNNKDKIKNKEIKK